MNKKLRAYFGIKYHEDHKNRNQVDSFVSVFKNDGIETVCVARDIEKWGKQAFSPQQLMQKTFEEIDKADFVILEMTEKGVGLGIEAGYAVAKKKPLVVLIKEEYELSLTMQGIANIVIEYKEPQEVKISQFLILANKKI